MRSGNVVGKNIVNPRKLFPPGENTFVKMVIVRVRNEYRYRQAKFAYLLKIELAGIQRAGARFPCVRVIIKNKAMGFRL